MKDRIAQLAVEAKKAHSEAIALSEEYAGKEMPADQKQRYEKLLDQVIDQTEEIKRLQAAGTGIALLDSPAGAALPVTDLDDKDPDDEPDFTPFQEQLAGFKGNQFYKGVVAKKNWRAAKRAWKARQSGDGVQVKGLQANDNSLGGYLVGPEQFVAEILIAVHDLTPIESLARVFNIGAAASLGAPSLDTTFNDADWTTEIAAANEDTALRTGKRELKPTAVRKLVKLSKALMRMSASDPEGLVRDELAYKFAVTKEKGFMTGNGSNQPLGLFTASTSGISTGRDVTATNATKVIMDDFIAAKMGLKAQYWTRPSTRWALHRLVLKSLMAEKATTGQYIWMMNTVGGLPPTILDVPYVLSEYAPSTLTTGLYVAIIGDLKFYWIANAMEFDIQVLTELYATNGQNGYLAELWSDGEPVLEEAFSRLKLA